MLQRILQDTWAAGRLAVWLGSDSMIVSGALCEHRFSDVKGGWQITGLSSGGTGSWKRRKEDLV